MPDPIHLAELERRNRASVRARAIWDGACALFCAGTGVSFRSCLADAEGQYEGLMQRCIAAEPPTDDNEFAYRGDPMKSG